ncbi:cyclic GMP-AMP synthase DncV-like nucleotidyltransferase [Desulforhopalus sp. 52FAK]
MSLQTQYIKFADAIALTRKSENYREAREKDNLITPKVEAAFKEEGYEIKPNFLQGSLATDTGIIPLDGDYDIDRAIVITKESSPDNPVDTKKIVKQVLSDHGFKTPVIKKPCVTANYKNKPIHIDYPIYRLDNSENYELAVGKENSDENNRSWDSADPKGLLNWIKSNTNHQSFLSSEELTSKEKSQFYRLVRYIKRWRDVKYGSESQRKKVFSIALTVMFKESFCPNIDTENGKADDHTALKDTLDVILNHKEYFFSNDADSYSIGVNLPVTPYQDIFNENSKTVGTLLRKRLKRLVDVLLEVDEKDSLRKKTEILNKHFGNDFPIFENIKKKAASKLSTLSATSGPSLLQAATSPGKESNADYSFSNTKRTPLQPRGFA